MNGFNPSRYTSSFGSFRICRIALAMLLGKSSKATQTRLNVNINKTIIAASTE